MTEAEAVEIICQRFVDAWPAASGASVDLFGGILGTLYGPLFGVASGGVPFTLEGEAKPSADLFAELTIRHSPRSGQRTQGEHPRIERQGWIWVKLWTPANAGIRARAQLADAARVVFERQQLGTGLGTDDRITVRTGATIEGGTDGRWMVSAVRCEMSYWEQTT